MSPSNRRISPGLVAVLSCLLVSVVRAEEPGAASSNLPIVKFFFFDAPNVEWVVSEDSGRFQQHLAANAESQALFNTASAAMITPAESSNSNTQMTRWIESERVRFDQSRREPARLRMAEGVIAYLRDHDFDIQKLVEALKRRSGATDVELVVIHLRDRQNNSAFKLKVVLVEPSIKIGKQGFNIDLPTANANYTTVAYALGVALYYVQEIIHGEPSPDGTKRDDTIEQLPAPQPVDARARNDEPAPVAG